MKAQQSAGNTIRMIGMFYISPQQKYCYLFQHISTSTTETVLVFCLSFSSLGEKHSGSGQTNTPSLALWCPAPQTAVSLKSSLLLYFWSVLRFFFFLKLQCWKGPRKARMTSSMQRKARTTSLTSHLLVRMIFDVSYNLHIMSHNCPSWKLKTQKMLVANGTRSHLKRYKNLAIHKV